MRILTQEEFSHYVDTKFSDYDPAVIWRDGKRYTFYVANAGCYYRILILYRNNNCIAMIYNNNKRHAAFMLSSFSIRYLLDSIYEKLYCG